MTNMKLSQILENVKVKNEYIDVEITDVTADSRKVEKGSLFVCIFQYLLNEKCGSGFSVSSGKSYKFKLFCRIGIK